MLMMDFDTFLDVSRATLALYAELYKLAPYPQRQSSKRMMNTLLIISRYI